MARDYHQLDGPTQVTQIRSRLRELESQHLQLQLRIDAPSPHEQVMQEDYDTLAVLEASIEKLKSLHDEVVRPERANDKLNPDAKRLPITDPAAGR